MKTALFKKSLLSALFQKETWERKRERSFGKKTKRLGRENEDKR